MLNIETRFEQAVQLSDIVSVSQLEQHVLSTTTKPLANELSLFVDTALKHGAEVATRDTSPTRDKYAGCCALIRAEPEFFVNAGVSRDHVYDPDGVSGWSHALSNPDIKPILLECTHLRIFMDDESISKVASTILSLFNEGPASNIPSPGCRADE